MLDYRGVDPCRGNVHQVDVFPMDQKKHTIGLFNIAMENPL